MRLLLVEDNSQLSQLLTTGLDAAGFETDAVATGEAAVEALSAVQYSAVVLDLGLPDRDGLSVLLDLRRRENHIPVLVLTARNGVQDRIKGLRSGADDYLVKPFAFDELVARLQALLRRPGSLLGAPIRLGNVMVDTSARQVTVADKVEFFSPREFAVLEVLLRRTGHVVPKKLLEDNLYGLMGDVGSNAIEVYIHRVRKQLSEVGANVEIHTIRGVGYLMREKK